MFELKVETGGQSCVVKLKGELNIERGSELKACLIQALGTADRVVIDLDGATEMSLSCLQLLCAAHKTARAGNKAFIIMDQRPEFIDRFVFEAGFLREGGGGLFGQGGRPE